MPHLSQERNTALLPYAAAVIVAAGSASRFGADKMMADLCGMPVLARTILAFEKTAAIGEIVVVSRAGSTDSIRMICETYHITKVHYIVTGGDTRARSCLAGAIAAPPEAELIAVQDGARPLVTEDIILDALWTAYRCGAAVPAVPVRDTVKVAAEGVVADTLDRAHLYAVQTPQCFQADMIRAALADAAENAPDVTDDSMAVERMGGRIYLSRGSEENIKITTPLDLRLAEFILTERNRL